MFQAANAKALRYDRARYILGNENKSELQREERGRGCRNRLRRAEKDVEVATVSRVTRRWVRSFERGKEWVLRDGGQERQLNWRRPSIRVLQRSSAGGLDRVGETLAFLSVTQPAG